MKKHQLLLVISTLLFLAACFTPAAYGPLLDQHYHVIPIRNLNHIFYGFEFLIVGSMALLNVLEIFLTAVAVTFMHTGFASFGLQIRLLRMYF